MKISLANSAISGGAGTACRRFHEQFVTMGIDSELIVAGETQNVPKCISISDRRLSSISRFCKKSRKALIHRRQVQWAKRNPSNMELMSPPYSDEPKTLSRLTKQSDVVNLHWVPHLLDWKYFFGHLGKQQVVWTFHDQNPLTGALHYRNETSNINRPPVDPYECKIWNHILSLQPQLNTQTTVVTPSRWLTNLAKEHPFWQQSNCVTIHNGIDLDRFTPNGPRNIRKRYGIPESASVLLFVADQVDQKRKGGDLLAEVISKLDPVSNWHSISVGRGNSPFKHPNHTHIGSIHDENRMSEVYRSADLLVVPSRVDNLPNTAVEAAGCGTPSIAFKQGGMCDIIEPETGILIAPYDTESMANEIASLIGNPARVERLSEGCRAKAEADFDICKQSLKYLQLFKVRSEMDRSIRKAR